MYLQYEGLCFLRDQTDQHLSIEGIKVRDVFTIIKTLES